MHKSDDFSVLLAVARANSLSGAARTLNVSHTTVSRRLRELEQALGARLISHKGNQVVLTAQGQDAVRVAIRLEDEVWRLTRRISQKTGKLSGEIRLASVDFLAALYAPRVHGFCAAHPALCIEVLTSTDTLNLAAGEADVALRLGDPGDNALVGRVVDRITFGLYRSRTVDTDRNLTNESWIAYSGRGCGRYTEPWRDRIAPDGRIVAKVATPLIMEAMIRSGTGIGLLPHQLAASSSDLVCIEAADSIEVDVWLLVTEAARQDLRVRAFLDHF